VGNPEEFARKEIDRQLKVAGWVVQDRKAVNLHVGAAVAVRELPLASGPVDCLFYVDGVATGAFGSEVSGLPARKCWSPIQAVQRGLARRVRFPSASAKKGFTCACLYSRQRPVEWVRSEREIPGQACLSR
jgi:hypothetical protein